MHRYVKTGLSTALAALAASMVQACAVGPAKYPAMSSPARHLSVVQADEGFIIRTGTPVAAQPTAAPGARAITPVAGPVSAPVVLGDTVRFDRAALLPTQQKDNDHGEIR